MCSRSLGVVGGSFLARRPYAVALGLLLAAPRLAPLGTLGLSARPASRFAATGGNERRQRRSANAPPPRRSRPAPAVATCAPALARPARVVIQPQGYSPKPGIRECSKREHNSTASGSPYRASVRAVTPQLSRQPGPRRTGGAEGSTAVKAASRRWRGGRWRSPGVLAPGSAHASTVAVPPRAPPSAVSPDSRAPSNDSGARGARQRRRGCGGGQRPPCAAWHHRCAGQGKSVQKAPMDTLSTAPLDTTPILSVECISPPAKPQSCKLVESEGFEKRQQRRGNSKRR